MLKYKKNYNLNVFSPQMLRRRVLPNSDPGLHHESGHPCGHGKGSYMNQSLPYRYYVWNLLGSSGNIPDGDLRVRHYWHRHRHLLLRVLLPVLRHAQRRMGQGRARAGTDLAGMKSS